MRERTITVAFTTHCLGNKKLSDGTGRFVFQRAPNGQIVFLSSWHRDRFKLAANLLGRHQGCVQQIFWDIHVQGELRKDCWYRAFYKKSDNGRWRYTLHEAFFPGQELSLHCAVPDSISDEDLRLLTEKAGHYHGMSPWRPWEFGFYTVQAVVPRISFYKDSPIGDDAISS